MAVPKKQSSRSRRNMRRFSSSNRLRKITISTCPECGEPVRPHALCSKLTDCDGYKKRFESKGTSPQPQA